MATDAHEQLHTAVRQHWGIENRLRWSLDVIFREDDAKIRKDNGPRNISPIRKIILNMFRGHTNWPKTSLKGRRKRRVGTLMSARGFFASSRYDERIQLSSIDI